MLDILLFAAAATAEPPFPERVPGMMERCIHAAIESGDAGEEEQAHKYMCTGAPAETLWAWLEEARLPSWEQDTPTEGRWLSRTFPLGSCFKRLSDREGRPADTGLSCSIWIPVARSGAEPAADDAG